MRKLIMKMSISIDGFVATTNGKLDWVFRNSDPESKAWTVNLCEEAGLHIMGSKSFQNMASYWPTATDAFAAPMNETPKAVFTQKGFNAASCIPPGVASLPTAASWAGARVFDGDLAEAIRQLKQEPGKPILAHGGAAFMRSLINTGLIDEYNLVTVPVALGEGLPIFTDLAKPLDLKLGGVKAFAGGIVVHTYHPA